MPKRSTLPRVLGLLAAITCTCATLAFAAQVAPEKQDAQPARNAQGSPELIILDASPEGAAGQLPPVVFDHALHTQGDTSGQTCAACHEDPGAKSGYPFKGTAGKSGKALENAFHDGCFSCHEARSAKGAPSGPQKAECRSCHDANALPATTRSSGAGKAGADGGMDSSLHARHIASDLIPPTGADKTNCATCHHPVEKPLSPDLKADSCRSCHLPRNAKKQPLDSPPFADTAHATCISCHQRITASGKADLPVTCTSCHNAAAKAGYEKLSPPPRLDAGQPDKLVMGLPASPGASALPPVPPQVQGSVPDAKLDAKGQAKGAMPPVVFDHKRHEAQTDNCISCHHNSMRKCSSCHTLTGGGSGKPVPLPEAMHLPTSDRSCVGCHETRKTATPECAGCHAIIPKKLNVQPKCETCHQPVTFRKLPAADPRLQPDAAPVPPTSVTTVGGFRPAGPPVLPLPRPGTPEERIANAINAAPEKVVIGILADEFEPSVFPHRAIVQSLAEGIKKTSPGMLRLHADPYTICASCHHNSPPSATPPTCVSCHAKNMKTASASVAKDGRPLLKEAYHQQCMSCHTAMNITKPANTDCASCHAKRVTGREGGR
ncbi:cytochrome c family protein [Desulfovibrio sp. OttesenSCG-928-O18]|nr:cytochrome c family protein [Desulfovibrio sp. OttesenSCG-928-O18]